MLPEGVPAEALIAGEAKAAATGKAAGKGKSDRVATPAAARPLGLDIESKGDRLTYSSRTLGKLGANHPPS